MCVCVYANSPRTPPPPLKATADKTVSGSNRDSSLRTWERRERPAMSRPWFHCKITQRLTWKDVDQWPL